MYNRIGHLQTFVAVILFKQLGPKYNRMLRIEKTVFRILSRRLIPVVLHYSWSQKLHSKWRKGLCLIEYGDSTPLCILLRERTLAKKRERDAPRDDFVFESWRHLQRLLAETVESLAFPTFFYQNVKISRSTSNTVVQTSGTTGIREFVICTWRNFTAEN